MTTELRLTFSRRDDGWNVVLNPNWGADPSEPTPFRSPLAEKDYEDLRWYLEEFMDFPGAGDYVRAQDVERRLEAWGGDLYEQLFGHGDRRDLLNDLLDGDPPRVLSIASKESEVLRVPWELLRSRRPFHAARHHRPPPVRGRAPVDALPDQAAAAHPARRLPPRRPGLH